MPRNGSGVYNLPPGINPVVTQTLITSNWANTTLNDLAAAVTQSIARDGQTTITANLPMNGFRHTGVGLPTARNQYATLGMTQDAAHMRLTDVVGSDNITGNLPGNPTALVNGQMVELIPTVTNTGAVTLNINGIGAVPVLTQAGNELSPGTLVMGTPYLLMYNGTSFVVLTSGGITPVISQSTMTGWDRPVGGVYPDLGIVNTSTISIPAGTGRIVAPGSIDFSTVTEVSWPGQNVVITSLATQWSTIIGIDSTGSVVQLVGTFSPTWARDYILLGEVSHINGAIDSVSTRPSIYGDMIYAAYDTASLTRNTLIAGGNLSGNTTDPMHIDMSGGTMFGLGLSPNQVNSPNVLQIPNTTDVEFYPVTGASGVEPSAQNIPVTNYDPDGTGVVTPIPGSPATATIFRLYYLAGEFLLLYGQQVYGDLDTALASVSLDSASLVIPAKLTNATLIGLIVAQKDTTDLSDITKARFLRGDSFGSSGGGGGSISDAPVDGNIYGRRNAAWDRTILAPNGPAGTFRLINFQTDDVDRFAIGLDNTPEAGGNVGSAWVFRVFNDAGVFTGNAIEITRPSRFVRIPNNFGVTGTSTFESIVTLIRNLEPIVKFRATGNTTDNQRAQISVSSVGNLSASLLNDAENVTQSNVTVFRTGGYSLTTGGTQFWSNTPGFLRGDFTSAYPSANRMTFQTSVANSTTEIVAAPSGTGTSARWSVANSSDMANASILQLRIDGTTAWINSTKTGTGLDRDINIAVANDTRVVVSNTGRATFITKAGSGGNIRLTNSTQVNNLDIGIGRSLDTDPDAFFFNRANGAIWFGTNNTLRMNIQADGTVAFSGNVTAVGTATLNGMVVGSNGGREIQSPATTVILSATGAGGTVYLRPRGPADATGEMTVSGTGVVKANPTGSGPTNAGTFGFISSGNFGGGYSLQDATGLNRAGIWISGSGGLGVNIGVNDAAGGVSLGTGAYIRAPGGPTTLESAGGIRSLGGTGGVNAGLSTIDRTNNARVWTFYGNSDSARVNASSIGDILTGTTAGVWSATNFNATSDRRLKDLLGVQQPRDFSSIALWHFRWKKNGLGGFGPMAQDIEAIAPEHVSETDGVKSIDKGGIAIEWAASLETKLRAALARIEELERRLENL